MTQAVGVHVMMVHDGRNIMYTYYRECTLRNVYYLLLRII